MAQRPEFGSDWNPRMRADNTAEFDAIFTSDDARERTRAFTEKRQPLHSPEPAKSHREDSHQVRHAIGRQRRRRRTRAVAPRGTGREPLNVVAVTAVDNGDPVGLTIGSLVSPSVEPPGAGYVAGISSATRPGVRRAGSFCVNLLAADQQHLAGALAAPAADTWQPAPITGAPVLPDVIAWLDCRFTDVLQTGNHCLVVGDVVDLAATPGENPLLFHRGSFTTLRAQEPDTSTVTS